MHSSTDDLLFVCRTLHDHGKGERRSGSPVLYDCCGTVLREADAS